MAWPGATRGGTPDPTRKTLGASALFLTFEVSGERSKPSRCPGNAQADSAACPHLRCCIGSMLRLEQAPGVRGCSSDGRALQSHCRGQGFDSPQLHHPRRLISLDIHHSTPAWRRLRVVLSRSPRPAGCTARASDAVGGSSLLFTTPQQACAVHDGHAKRGRPSLPVRAADPASSKGPTGQHRSFFQATAFRISTPAAKRI